LTSYFGEKEKGRSRNEKKVSGAKKKFINEKKGIINNHCPGTRGKKTTRMRGKKNRWGE